MIARVAQFEGINVQDSEENAQAVELTFDEEMPKKLGEIFDGWEGGRVSVDHYASISDERR